MLFFADKFISAYLWPFAIGMAVVLGLGRAQSGQENSANEVTNMISNPVQVIPGHGSPCLVPPHPIDGRWKLHRRYCEQDTDCHIPQGFWAPRDSELIFNCKPGYRLTNDAEVRCTATGNWSVIPHCIATRCDTLNSVSRISTCHRSNEKVDCDLSVLPGTLAQVSCRPGYSKDTAPLLERGETVVCRKNGKWEPEPARCSAACGITMARQPSLAVGETVGKQNDFPWHAYLLTETELPGGVTTFAKLGATLIRPDLLLTCANCVYNETAKAPVDPRRIFVLPAGGAPVPDYPKLDLQALRKNAVKNVYLPCGYPAFSENEAANIALIEMEKPFVLSSSLLPACLDVPGDGERFLEPGAYGRIPVIASAIENYKGLVYTAPAPYLPASEADGFKNSLRNDTFFTDGLNASRTYQSWAGNGVVFQRDGRWYLTGIQLATFIKNQNTPEETDDTIVGLHHTKVSYHVPWILDVISNLQHHGSHPPCSRDN